MLPSATSLIAKYNKIYHRKSNTNDSRNIENEPLSATPIVYASDVWFDTNKIPTSGANLTTVLALTNLATYTDSNSGQLVIRRYINALTSVVSGSPMAFYNANLVDCIPTWFTSDYSYQVRLYYNNSGVPGGEIAYRDGNWEIDSESGIVRFYMSASAVTAFVGPLPPFVSFWRYIGRQIDDVVESVIAVADNALPLSGGTMTGDINMGNHNITTANTIDGINGTFTGDLNCLNLIVNGAMTTYETQTVLIGDNTIVVNNGSTMGRNAGLLVSRFIDDVVSDTPFYSGTAVTATSNTITFPGDASATVDYYVGMQVKITNNTPSGVLGQIRSITAYNGTTKIATLTTVWTITPTSSTTFSLYNKNFVGIIYKEASSLFSIASYTQDSVTTLSEQSYISMQMNQLYSNGVIISDTTDATSSTSGGTITTAGGAAIAKALYVGGLMNITGVTTLTNTTDTTSSSTGALIISGGIGCGKSIYAQNLTLAGNTITDTTVVDNTNLGLTSMYKTLQIVDGGRSYYTGTSGDSSLKFVILSNDGGGTPDPDIQVAFDGSTGVMYTRGLNLNGVFTSTLTTASTSNSTGSILISGGLGISNATDATSSTNGGTFTTAGGAAITKALYVGGLVNITGVITGTNTTTSTSNSIGALKLAGGLGISNTTDASSSTNGGTFTTAGGAAIAKALYVGGLANITGVITGTNTTTSTSNSTGALKLAGGLGISNVTDATSSTNGGTFTTAGGAAIAKALYVGGLVEITGIITGTNTTASTSSTVGALELSGGISISNTTNSGSATNGGTFTTAGGAAVTKNLYVGSSMIVTGTSNPTSINNIGSLFTYGGLTVVKDTYMSNAYIGRSVATTSGIASYLSVTHSADTAQTADTESPTVLFDFSAATRRWADSAPLSLQRYFLINQPTISFTFFGTVTDIATIGIDGAPIRGSFATVTNTHALLIGSGAVGAPTNSYGLSVNAQTGATNNYCAQFIGGNVGIGIAAPTNTLHVSGTTTITGIVTLSGTTTSTSSSTGILKLAGGLGISNTTDATSSTNGGTFTTAGGAAITKALYVGGLANITGVITGTNTTTSTSNSTGALKLAGGLGISNTTDATSSTNGGTFTTAGGAAITKALYVGGLANIIGIITGTNTTTSTSNSTGALILAGGIGLSNITNSTSVTNGGTITTAGGISVAKDAYLGNCYVGRSAATSSGVASYLSVTHSADTDQTTLTESPTVLFDFSTAIRTWASGAITIQRFFKINQPTIAFAGVSAIADVATVGILGAPIQGTNATVTNTHALLINVGAVSTATNSYGLSVNAQTGATSNYCAQFLGGNVGIGISAPTNTLHVVGTTTITGIVTLSGTTASTSNTVGNLLMAGGLSISNTTNATSVTNGGTITTAGGVAIAQDLYVGGLLGLTGTITISDTTASTSSTTGALKLVGGIGINNTTDAVSSTNGGTITTAGGVAIAKALYVGGLANITGVITGTNTTTSTSNSTGALKLTGGLGISNTTDATSSTNGGTFTTAGGAAIAKALYVGGLANVTGVTTITNTTISSSPTTGALIVSGGIGCNENIWGQRINLAGSGVADTSLQDDTNIGITGLYTTIHVNDFGKNWYQGSSSNIFTKYVMLSGDYGGGGDPNICVAYDLVTKTLFTTGLNLNGIITSTLTTASTSSSTGSLLLAGGIGISNSTDATSSTNGGTFTTAGGAAIAKALYVGGLANIIGIVTLSDTTASTSNTIGNLLMAGGLSISNTTDATSSTNGGTFTTAGGVAIAKALYVGGLANITGVITGTNTTASTTTTTGALILAGGIGCAKGIYAQTLSLVGSGTTDTTIGDSTNLGLTSMYKTLLIADNGGRAYYQGTSGDDPLKYIILALDAGGAPDPDVRIAFDANTATLYIQSINLNNTFTSTLTTTTTSSSTGAMKLAGGLGISNTTNSTSVTNGGTMTTAGGIAVAKDAYIGNVYIGRSTATSSGIASYLSVTHSADTAQTTLTESPTVLFNFTTTRTWANGDITIQRYFKINQPTIAFASVSSLVTDVATVGILGAPIQGTNASITNTHALLINVGAVSTATNSYGLSVNAQTGATSNYCAQFLGGNVGIGISAPTNTLHVVGTTTITGIVTLSGTVASTSSSVGNLLMAGGLSISNTTDATSSTNGGTFTTAGGAAIAKALYVGGLANIIGIVTLSDTTASTSNTVGNLLMAGGLSISNATNATSVTNGGTITTAGGVAIAQDLYVGGLLGLTGSITISDTTASTSSTTGALKLVGGIGINNTTDASSSTNGGTFTTAGGAAIAKSLYVGTNITIGDATDVSGTIIATFNTARPWYIYQYNTGVNASLGFKPLVDTKYIIITSADQTQTLVTFKPSDTINGGLTNFYCSLISNGVFSVIDSTTSTSNSTGCVKLAGGLGISNTTDATSSTNGGTFTTAGGVAIAKALYVGGLVNITGVVTITNTTDATSSTNGGTFTTAGGAAIAKSLYVGTNVTIGTGVDTSGTILVTFNTSRPWYIFQYSTGATSTLGFKPLTDGKAMLISSANQTQILVTFTPSNTAGAGSSNFYSSLISNGVFSVIDSTASTSNSTGCAKLAGGLGISNTTDATSSTNGGTFTTAGGVAIAKALYVGGLVNIIGVITGTNTTTSTSNSTGALILAGGIGISNTTDATSSTNGGTFTTAGGAAIAKALYVGGLVNITGVITISDTTTSTSNSTGALKLAGGIGISNTTDATSSTNGGTFTTAGGAAIAKALYVGGLVNITGVITGTATTDASSTTTGSLILSGGMSVGKKLYSRGIYITRSTPNNGINDEYFKITTAADTNLIASTEAPSIVFDLGLTKTWATGDIILQSGFKILQPRVDFVSSSTIQNCSTMYISGPPIQGAFASITYAHGLHINSTHSTNAAYSYGLTVQSTSAYNNDYCAKFIGGHVGIGSHTPSAILHVTKVIDEALINDEYLLVSQSNDTLWYGIAMPTVKFDLSTNNRIWPASTLATQSFILFTKPVLGANATSTCTNAITLHVTGAPAVGSNMTITNTFAFKIDSANVNSGITNSYGSYIIAQTGATNNYAAIFSGGNVGIGIAAPTNTLHVVGTTTISGIVTLSGTTASTSSSVGNLLMAGGLSISNTTNATSSTNGGTFTTAGGVAIAQDLYVGGLLGLTGAITISDTTASTSSTTGALKLVGGIGINNTTDAVSSTNGGTFTTAGGAAIAKALYVGGLANVTGVITGTATTDASSTSTGSLILAGGIGCGKSIYSQTINLVGDGVVDSSITNNTNMPTTTSMYKTLSFNDFGKLWYMGSCGDSNAKFILLATDSGAGNDPDIKLAYDTGIDTLYTTGFNMSGFFVNSTTNASTSLTLGAVKLSGGIGINNTTNSVSITNGGCITAAGGIAVAKDAYIGNVYIGRSAATSSGVANYLSVSHSADTAQTAGTESATVLFNFSSATRTWATTTLALQRFFLINQPTIDFTASSAMTNVATLGIAGAPVKGTNATVANTHAILISAGAVGVATASYGLSVNAQTGATSNYSAQFMGGNVGIGIATPTNTLHVSGTSTITGIVTLSGTTTSTSSSTGNLLMAGGLGISNTTDASSSTNGGTITTAGGAAIAKALYVGGLVNIAGVITGTNTTTSTTTTTGALIVAGGIGCAKAISCQNINLVGNAATVDITIRNDTNMTNATGMFETIRFTDNTRNFVTGSIQDTIGSSIAKFCLLGCYGGSGDTPVISVAYDFGNTTMYTCNSNCWTQTIQRTVAATTGSPYNLLKVSHSADAGMSAAEITSVYFDFSTTARSTAVGTIATQRYFRINQPSVTFDLATGTATSASTMAILGAPIAGTNAAIGTSQALLISATASLTSGTTNSYGITCNTQTGATNNYCAQFLGGNVGIGISAPTNTLHVSGTSTITGIVTLSGTTTSTSSSTGILLLAGGLGISNTTNATSSTNGGTFTTAGGVAIAQDLYVGGLANITGVITGTNTTTSTSNSTGALILAGGIGLSNATNATSSTNGGTITTAGGVAIAQDLYVGGLTNITGVITGTNTTTSTSNSTGALKLAGGLGISNTTDATSSTNGGTFTTAGGAAITKALYVGGLANITGVITGTNTTASTTTTTGALILAGGIGCAKGIYAQTLSLVGSGVTDTTIGDSTNMGLTSMYKTLLIADNTSRAYYQGTSGDDQLKYIILATDGGGAPDPDVRIVFDQNTATLYTQGINMNGAFTSTLTTTTTSSSTGAMKLAGGLGISNTTDATSSTNGGTFTTAGGAAITKALYVGGLVNITGVITGTNTTTSTSNSTGALKLAGGLGISNTTNATSVTNGGTITTAGGIAVAQDAYLGNCYVGRSAATSSGVASYLSVTHSADTAQTANTESPTVLFDFSTTRTWATGDTIGTQRYFKVNQPTIAFAGASVIADIATVGILGAPVKGTNATVTNTHALLISAGAVSTATNSYGLSVLSQTGATNNYCAQFLNGNVGIGAAGMTIASSALLYMSSTTKGFLKPVMTTAQKNAISTPSTGLEVYDSTLNTPAYYNGSAWQSLTSTNVISTVTSTNSNYTMTSANTVVLMANTNLGSYTATLPDASTCTGQVFTIIDFSGVALYYPVIIAIYSSTQRIGGSNNYYIKHNHGQVTLLSTGTGWVITSSNTNANICTQQQGATITGAASSYLGKCTCISGDGNTMYMSIDSTPTGGGPYTVTLGNVYTRANGVWSLESAITVTTYDNNTAISSPYYGSALSYLGNTLAVGVPQYNTNVGAVYVFTRSGTTWSVETSTPVAGTGGALTSTQGTSVALSYDGNTMASGAPGDSLSIGCTWVYTRSGTTWTQQQRLVGTGYTGSPTQGSSVDLTYDGNMIAIGGAGDATNVGATWVYTRTSGTWTQSGSKIVGTGTGNGQGANVRLDSKGNTLYIGASYVGGNSFWIFTRTAITTWTQQGSVYSELNSSANYGPHGQISKSGDRIITADDTYIYVYTRSGNTFTLQNTLTPSGTTQPTFASLYIRMSYFGDTIIANEYNSGGNNWIYVS